MAATLGRITTHPVSIVHIPLSSTTEAAYAAYVASSPSPSSTRTLTRITILNMKAYNTTVDGAGLVPLPAAQLTPRQTTKYTFDLGPTAVGREAVVRRLWASGSDAVSGISWDGWSFNWELDQGRPVRLANVTTGEKVVVQADGSVVVEVPDSSGAMLDFGSGPGCGK